MKPTSYLKLRLIISLLAFMSPVAQVFATSGGVGTGGGTYVVIDGNTKIADPYYAGVPVSKIDKITRVGYKDLPPEVRNYLGQIKGFMNRMFLMDGFESSSYFTYPGFYRGPFRNKTVETLFQKFIMSDSGYVLVPKSRENNVPCEHYLPKLSRPVDKQFQYACTFGSDTYLFIDKWKVAPVEEQAFAILHERLWATFPQADQADIAAFNAWLAHFELKSVKQLLHGDRKPVTAEEIAGVGEFYLASQKLGFLDESKKDAFTKNNYKVVSGGAIILGDIKDKVSIENSFLGVGTSIFESDRLNMPPSHLSISNSVILSSQIAIKSSTPVSMTDSWVSESRIEQSSLTKSHIERSIIHTTDAIERTVIDSSLGQGNYIPF